MINVRYVSNPEGNHTAIIRFSDGRPDLPLGGTGNVTTGEYAYFTGLGYNLFQIGVGPPDPPPPPTLASLQTDLTLVESGTAPEPVAAVTTGGALAVNKLTPVDATAGTVAMTLPTGQAVGTTIALYKADATANVVTVTGNIRGVAATTQTLTDQNESTTYVADSGGSWFPAADGKPKSMLDRLYDPAGAATAAVAGLPGVARVKRGLRVSSFCDRVNVVAASASFRDASPNTEATYVSRHTAQVACLGGAQLGFMMRGTDGPVTGSCTMEASIEYPIGVTRVGTFHRVLRGGLQTWTTTSGETFFTDPQGTFSIPEGEDFRVWVWVSSAVAGQWPYNLVDTTFGSGVGGHAYGVNGTAAGTAITSTGVRSFGPSAIIGLTDSATRAVCVVGDSQAVSSPAFFGERLRRQGVPFQISAVSGESLSTVNTETQRRAMYLGCSDVIVQSATNDFGINSATLAAVQARAITNWTGLSATPGVQRVYQTTVMPRVSGSAGAQVLVSSSADRESFSAWLRAGAPMTGGAAAAIGASGALLAGQVGHPLEDFIEIADLVESPKRSGFWDPALVAADLFHPNAAGYIVLQQRSINPVMFGGKEYRLPRGSAAKGYIPVLPGQTVTGSVPLTAGIMFLIPMEIGEEGTPTQIISSYVAGGVGLVRYCLYRADSRGRPSTLQWDDVTTDSTVGGGKTIGASGAQRAFRRSGRYLLGCIYEGAGAAPSATGVTGTSPFCEGVILATGANCYKYTITGGAGAPLVLTDTDFLGLGTIAPMMQINCP